MIEATPASQWIYTTLAVDPTIAAAVADRIFEPWIEQNETLPAIVFRLVDPGRDLLGVGTARVLVKLSYRVVVVTDSGSYTDSEPLANQIDTLLHGQSSASPGHGQVLVAVRQSQIRDTYTEDGKEYRETGGLYLLEVQP